MAEEFLESEILFADDSDSGKTSLNSDEYDASDSQNGILFYYSLNQVDEDEDQNSNRRQSYRIPGRGDSKAKSKGSAPIDIPAAAAGGGGRRRIRSRREREFEDYLPPHEILARRMFADDLLMPVFSSSPSSSL